MNIRFTGRKKVRDKGEIVEEMEQELFELEDYINIILEFLPIPFCYLSPKGVILNVDKAMEKFLKYPKEDIIGSTLSDFSSQKEKIIQIQKCTLEKGYIRNQECSIKNKDGKEIPVSISTLLRKDEKGNPISYFVAMTDLSEHLKMEEKMRKSEEKNRLAMLNIIEDLRESEGKYRTLIETAPDGIVTINRKGMIASCNAATLNLTGYSKDEIVGKRFSQLEFLRARENPKYLKLFTAMLRGKIPKPIEVEWYRKDGTTCWTEVHISRIKKGDKSTGFQAIARDITERKQAEEEMRRALKQERQFKLETAHYFFNPLCIARGYLDLAMKKTPEKRKKDLKAAHQAIERIEKVLENILQRGEIHE